MVSLSYLFIYIFSCLIDLLSFFADLLAHTPPTSASRSYVERAVEAACLIAERCDRAQGNAAFIVGRSGSSVSAGGSGKEKDKDKEREKEKSSKLVKAHKQTGNHHRHSMMVIDTKLASSLSPSASSTSTPNSGLLSVWGGQTSIDLASPLLATTPSPVPTPNSMNMSTTSRNNSRLRDASHLPLFPVGEEESAGVVNARATANSTSTCCSSTSTAESSETGVTSLSLSLSPSHSRSLSSTTSASGCVSTTASPVSVVLSASPKAKEMEKKAKSKLNASATRRLSTTLRAGVVWSMGMGRAGSG